MNIFKLTLSTCLLSILLLSSDTISAQEVNREIGLRASGLDNFNFIYKKQTSENKFFRFRAGAFGASYNTLSESFGANLSLSIGFEKRKAIDNKLSFIHGFEPTLFGGYQSSGDVFNAGLGLGYVLGFHVDVSDKLALNLETIPSLQGIYASNSENLNLNFGFNSNAVALTVAYKFVK